MSNSSKRINFILFILPVLVLSGCVTFYNPATQRNETLLIDTKAEVALGSDMDSQIQQRLKIVQDPRIQHRLDYIGSRVVNFSDRKDLTYHFRIVKDKQLNAFACPGGFIYVNSGLMDIANDNELAAVLAHEIGHVAARHSIKKLQAVIGYQVIMAVVMGLSKKYTLTRITDKVFEFASLGYSRQDELLADKLSVKYTIKAEFDPYGMVTFFEKLKKKAEKQGPNFNLVFLSSHPPIEERIKNVKNEIITYNP